MRTISRGVIIVTAVCALPFFANALSASDLAAQLQSLLAQVASLQQQLRALQSSPIVPAAPTNTCPSLFRSLSFGAQGSDVLSLQQFLVSQNLLSSASVTGSFDAATESAVQHLQAKYSIVFSGSPSTTGYGVVGPRTRSIIALNCNTSVVSPQSCAFAPAPSTICSSGWQANTNANGCTISYKCSIPLPGVIPTTPNACTAIALSCPVGTHDQVGPNCSHACVSNTQQSGNFSASPTSGNAPLAVVFTYRFVEPGAYSINFGDGNISSMSTSDVCTSTGTGAGNCTYTTSHTYTSAGTYTSTLRRILGACNSGGAANCNISETIGSVSITVGAGSSQTFSAAPQSGNAPLAVTFSWSWPNGGNNEYDIDFGDGTGYSCADCASNGVTSHTYNLVGTYATQFRQITGADSTGHAIYTVRGSASITVGAGNSQSCMIYSPPLCNSNEHLVSGPYNSSTGCYGAPQCVVNAGSNGTVPASVQAKYDATSSQYAQSIGATLKSCSKSSEFVYLVSGSGGFTAESHYYNSSGTLLGSVYYRDTSPFQTGTPPVNINEYSCTTLQHVGSLQ